MLAYLICILIHLKSIFNNFQHFLFFFDCLLLFLQNLVDGPDSDFHISDSSWSPSAVRHTVRSAAKNDRQSCEFLPILWHESKVMTKNWFWPTHFSQYQVAALSTYLLIFSKYNFIFSKYNLFSQNTFLFSGHRDHEYIYIYIYIYIYTVLVRYWR